ncbi:MAG: leucine--tRNA ligase [Candidatus Aminicenantes bacterium]|nr:leucine--tRNA ligase [Candidatus Aminicenantes bacterium]
MSQDNAARDYDFRAIEARWQKQWEESGAFIASEDPRRPKFYALEMYPYPSGRIHMGHVRNYSIGDVIARFKMMRGFNVLHPIGWDALGMPAENAAIKSGIHPQKWTMDNIAHMKMQLRRMGFAYDWSREVNTCLPEYYRWNQWIFLKMFERGLAYRRESWVNWCPSCRTVLANEQAAGGSCWRCSSAVEQKKMEQWVLKITDYADELLSGHAQLGKWPEHVLAMQKNWIGRSEGADLDFFVPALGKSIRVFTTRLDTIFGATFLVLSPEHPLVDGLVRGPREAELRSWISKTIAAARAKREIGEADKEGVDTGMIAINPFTGKPVPIWLANYVLMEYGTGAIMAVPAHDGRDFDFAKKYGLEIREVIVPKGGAPSSKESAAELFEDFGLLVNSGPYDGLPSVEAIEKMAAWARDKGCGEKAVTFRLRDWGISRQRYWGTPIPMIYCETCGIVPVPYEDLPVRIPYNAEFTGEAGSPLEKIPSFVNVACPKCGRPGRRETDTMDTFVDSSWYYFRYASPAEETRPFTRAAADRWLPVDLYIGGVEHAILHLIYSRFFTKLLRDLGLTAIDEPFPHYLAQGMVTKDGSAMSKSKGNVVDPDEMLLHYGADALRLFILFAAPPEKEFAWNEEGIEGCYRFLGRVWQMFREIQDLRAAGPTAPSGRADSAAFSRLRKKMHQTIRKVGADVEHRFHLNTAVSAIMEFTNVLKKEKDSLRNSVEGRALLSEAMEALVLALAPFTPHISEEMWRGMGHETLVLRASWPAFDPDLAKEEKATIVVEINGKVREKFETEHDTAENDIKTAALALPRIRQLLEGHTVRKVVIIKGKIINIVV